MSESFLTVCSQLVVEIVRIIRICFQMSTLICKNNTNKCKLTTNIPIFCLQIALKAFCSKVFAIFSKNTTFLQKYDKRHTAVLRLGG